MSIGSTSRLFFFWQMLEQLTSYYLIFEKKISGVADFHKIGESLFRAYPSIRREGKHPWSAVTRILSQRMRTARYACMQDQYTSCLDVFHEHA